LYRIFGPSIPYVLEIRDINFDEDDVFNKQDEHKKNKKKKRRKSGTNLVEDCRDNKEVSDDSNSKNIIPMEYYNNPFKEWLESTEFKYFLLAPMQLHQKGLKEDSIKWLRTKKMGSHKNIKK
jgi:hypothetical protein